MPSTFEVLAEPARREILDLLVAGPRPVNEIVAATGLSQPNTSRHLRILREALLVDRRSDGQRRVYRLRREGFAELTRWLEPYMRLWQSGLDALQERLERGD
ncbi:MAG TPA: metalloregulator ArsR/SmtB family transcription factor [Solirubrobacteraceae bacterium]|nr:metalloregulator ArsR/SmtB family transcription factor [Solirubrobacteraceae bacterium]